MKRKNLKHILYFVLISIAFIVALSIFQCVNDDFLTHISRTYNLSISMKNGDFNPYMYQSCYLKYGYPFGVFYPDTYLKPFSFLIMLGLPVYGTMMLLLFFINFFTLYVPYILLKQTKLKEYAFTISVLYFLYPYRFIDYILRFSIGELFFFIFFPFILFGLYKTFVKKEVNFYLFFGFLGIIHGHILSTFLIALFLICFYLFNIRKIDKFIIKITFINFILTLISCVDIYLPILEAQLTETGCKQTHDFWLKYAKKYNLEYTTNFSNL